MICILAHGGASSRDDPERRSKEWRPPLRREPQRKGGPDPDRQALWRGAGSRCRLRCPTAGSRLRGSASENRHGGAPRGVPVAPGQGGRASQARPKDECGLSALHHPLIGGTELLVSRRPLAPKPRGLADGRKSEGICEETHKPGRSNAPRERTTLRCLTS